MRNRQDSPIGRRGQARRDLYLATLKSLLEDTSVNYRKISVHDLAAIMNCSPGSFYHYWDDLDEAIAEILRAELDEMGTEDPEELSRRMYLIFELMKISGWDI